MPVILEPGAEGLWLAPDAEEDELLGLLAPVADGVLAIRDVGDYVNDVREDGAHLLEARPEAASLF